MHAGEGADPKTCPARGVRGLIGLEAGAPERDWKLPVYLDCLSFVLMGHSRTMANLEADIVALRAAAERAGTALACLFSTSDEFEAAVVRVRREQGAFRAAQSFAPFVARPRAGLRSSRCVFVLI